MPDSQPMWLRLRQIALVAERLAPVEAELIDVLGIEVCFRDPGVGHFGLENALFPIGNQLLEGVAPTQEQTAGGRYLERRGGDSALFEHLLDANHGRRSAGALPSSWSIDRLWLTSRAAAVETKEE